MRFLLFIFTTMAYAATPGLPTIVALKGQVKVLSANGVNMPSMIYEGEKFYYQEARIGLKVPEGSLVTCANDARAKLVYPSGTSLWVGPGSMMKVVKGEPAAAGGTSYLSLVYGRVRAMVTKQKESVWQLKTPGAINGVRGTDFVTGYSPVTGTETSVLSGKVEVSPVVKTQPKVTLASAQSVREVPSSGALKVVPLQKTEVISAYELTVIPPPNTPIQPEVKTEVAQLEDQSKKVVIEELRKSQPEAAKDLPPTITAEQLNRKVIERPLQKAQASSKNTPLELPNHDLDNYKKFMDEGK